MDKKAILIVDDVPKNIQLVAKFLKNEGYDLFFAQNGTEALRQVETKMFDLILLDVMMPGMDGFVVCRTLKENVATQNIPVIFLTAKTDDEAIAKGFASGGVDYITKPFNPAELIARVKTHIDLRQRETQLQDVNNTKDTLLSVISHDLKTPFFNIMGLGDLLLSEYDEYDDEMKKEMIGNIVDAAKVSHSLLDNLLNWTRVQTGKIKYVPGSLILENIINENLKLLKSQFESKEIENVLDVEADLKVYADKQMLHTILRNLISNAIKYTPRKGKVTIKAYKSENKIVISVIDTGVGIDENKLNKLFKEIDTMSTPGTESEPGSGFGLILTNEFINKNKGTIDVKSEVGAGTEFTITLPKG